MSKIFNWKIVKITLYIFGGCCFFDEKQNKPLKEELLILLAGPIFQIIYFLIMRFLNQNNLLSIRNYLILKNYHYTLLSFNLLPIYPLDGGKLLNIITNYLFPLKKSNKIVIYISYILVFLIFFKYHSLNYVLMEIFLFTEITNFLKSQYFLYNKFLLERYLYKYNFKKSTIIDDENKMYKERKHLLHLKNKYYTEEEYLNNRFNFRR